MTGGFVTFDGLFSSTLAQGSEGFCYDLRKGAGNKNPTFHVQRGYGALERRDRSLGSGLARMSLGPWDPSPIFAMGP